MDDRQQNIEVGAGLQESRINQELLDWLNKWGSWILTGVLIVVLAYLGYIKYLEYQADRRDKAFDAYMNARGDESPAGVLAGSPDSLIQIANEREGIGSVSHLARLDAANIYLGWARLGLAPGAITELSPEPGADDYLTPEEQNEMYARAYALFQQVANETSARPELGLIRLNALKGMAASSLSLEEFDRAKAEYEQAVEIANAQGLPDLATYITTIIEDLPNYRVPIAVYPEEQLPREIRPVEEQDIPASGSLDDALRGGGPIRIGPDGTIQAETEVVPVEPEQEGDEDGTDDPDPSPDAP